MVRIITDSTSDMSAERRSELGIDSAPLTVYFGEESFFDGIDLTPEAFYKKLSTAEKLPTTSQVSPAVFQEMFQKYTDQGDEVVGIFISSKLSGTYQSACMAQDMVKSESIHVIDSLTTTFGLRLLVEEAVKMRDAGMSAAEITEAVSELIPRIRLIAVVGTLKYLKMGGRLSSASATLGTILGICPIVSVIDGLVESVGKCRGQKSAFEFIHKSILREEIDTSHFVAFGHTADQAKMDELKDYLLPKVPEINHLEGVIGSVIGTHAGPGATGIAYITKN